VKVEQGVGQKRPKKRSSGGSRKGEPRRCQNMIAQKKYRDKKVQASALVSYSHAQQTQTDFQMSTILIDIKAVLRYGNPETRLVAIETIMRGFAVEMNGE